MIPNLELNLTRWIYASASKAFSERLAPYDIQLYLEGTDRRTDELRDYFEFRLDGPFVNQLSHSEMAIDIEINILIVAKATVKDPHKIYRSCGVVLQAFKDPISIKRHGDGPDDDGSYVECLTIVRSGDIREAVRVSHFGKLDPAKPILQSSVEGHYHSLLILR